jgi:putative DNA primase/helicase
VPYQARDPQRRASVTAPDTWASFSEALAVVRAGRADGPGIVVGAGLGGVDLDHCFMASALTDEAAAIVRTLDTYTEVSPSGDGVHALAHGTLPPGRRRKGMVEMYSEKRFFTVTGRHLAGAPWTIEERTAALAAVHARYLGTPAPPPQGPPPPVGRAIATDAALLARAREARNGAKFAALWRGDTTGYRSHSEADLALCGMLAFWTARDAARIDQLFRASGLMRSKWDAARGEQTYGAQTIASALAGWR